MTPDIEGDQVLGDGLDQNSPACQSRQPVRAHVKNDDAIYCCPLHLSCLSIGFLHLFQTLSLDFSLERSIA